MHTNFKLFHKIIGFLSGDTSVMTSRTQRRTIVRIDKTFFSYVGVELPKLREDEDYDVQIHAREAVFSVVGGNQVVTQMIVDAALRYRDLELKAQTPLAEKIREEAKENLRVGKLSAMECADMVADQLRLHYGQERNRQIETMTGETFDIADYFVKLAIVKGIATSQAERNKLQDPGKDREGVLQNFEDILAKHKAGINFTQFLTDRTVNGQDIRTRRVLLVGRAGVGKTTACQRMVYEWQSPDNPLWEGKTVFWLCVRHLVHDKDTEVDHDWKYHLAGLLLNECMGLDPGDAGWGPQLIAVHRLLEDPEAMSQTVFVLDGYDESDVMQDWIRKLFEDHILGSEQDHSVVVTTRPTGHYPFSYKAADAIFVENLGFDDEGIERYVRVRFKDTPAKADELMGLFERRKEFHGIAHIPIQLSILCRLCAANRLRDDLTMTQLYKEMKLDLRKVFAQKPTHPTPGKDSLPIGTATAEIIITQLALLAYQGMDQGKLVFSPTAVDAIWTQSREKIRNHSLYYMDQSGFVKRSSHGEYYFLHLTIQEYLAAYHLHTLYQRGDKSDKKYKNDVKKVEDFFSKHKYNPRFEMVIRFFCGLCDSTGGGGSEFARFFRWFSHETPEDAMEAGDALLSIKCLDEHPDRDGLYNAIDSSCKTLRRMGLPARSHQMGLRSQLGKEYVEIVRWSTHIWKRVITTLFDQIRWSLDDKEAVTSFLEFVKKTGRMPDEVVEFLVNGFQDETHSAQLRIDFFKLLNKLKQLRPDMRGVEEMRSAAYRFVEDPSHRLDHSRLVLESLSDLGVSDLELEERCIRIATTVRRDDPTGEPSLLGTSLGSVAMKILEELGPGGADRVDGIVQQLNDHWTGNPLISVGAEQDIFKYLDGAQPGVAETLCPHLQNHTLHYVTQHAICCALGEFGDGNEVVIQALLKFVNDPATMRRQNPKTPRPHSDRPLDYMDHIVHGVKEDSKRWRVREAALFALIKISGKCRLDVVKAYVAFLRGARQPTEGSRGTGMYHYIEHDRRNSNELYKVYPLRVVVQSGGDGIKAYLQSVLAKEENPKDKFGGRDDFNFREQIQAAIRSCRSGGPDATIPKPPPKATEEKVKPPVPDAAAKKVELVAESRQQLQDAALSAADFSLLLSKLQSQKVSNDLINRQVRSIADGITLRSPLHRAHAIAHIMSNKPVQRVQHTKRLVGLITIDTSDDDKTKILAVIGKVSFANSDIVEPVRQLLVSETLTVAQRLEMAQVLVDSKCDAPELLTVWVDALSMRGEIPIPKGASTYRSYGSRQTYDEKAIKQATRIVPISERARNFLKLHASLDMTDEQIQAKLTHVGPSERPWEIQSAQDDFITKLESKPGFLLRLIEIMLDPDTSPVLRLAIFKQLNSGPGGGGRNDFEKYSNYDPSSVLRLLPRYHSEKLLYMIDKKTFRDPNPINDAVPDEFTYILRYLNEYHKGGERALGLSMLRGDYYQFSYDRNQRVAEALAAKSLIDLDDLCGILQDPEEKLDSNMAACIAQNFLPVIGDPILALPRLLELLDSPHVNSRAKEEIRNFLVKIKSINRTTTKEYVEALDQKHDRHYVTVVVNLLSKVNIAPHLPALNEVPDDTLKSIIASTPMADIVRLYFKEKSDHMVRCITLKARLMETRFWTVPNGEESEIYWLEGVIQTQSGSPQSTVECEQLVAAVRDINRQLNAACTHS